MVTLFFIFSFTEIILCRNYIVFFIFSLTEIILCHANSVDPDQTPRSLIWIYTDGLGNFLERLVLINYVIVPLPKHCFTIS